MIRREWFIGFMRRISPAIFYATLVMLFLRPSFLKFTTPLGRISLTSVQGLALFFCAAWLLGVLFDRRRFFVASGLEYPVCAFLAVSLISAIFSPFGGARDRADAVAEIFFYSVFFYASLWVYSGGVKTCRVFMVWSACALAVAFADVAYHYREGIWKMVDRGYPFWDGKNALGLFMVLSLAVGITGLSRRGILNPLFKAICSIGLFIVFLGVIYSYSRAAWIAMLGVAAVFAVARSWKFAVFIVVALIPLSYLPHTRALNRFRSIAAMNDRNVDKRLQVWKNALRIIELRPVLGTGPGGFRAACAAVEKKQETRHVVRAPGERFTYRDHAHNLLLQIGAETGVAGLAIFVWACICVGVMASRRIRHAPSAPSRAEALSIAAALAGFMVYSLFDCSWTGRFASGSFMHINLIVALLVAMLCADPKAVSGKPNRSAVSCKL